MKASGLNTRNVLLAVFVALTVVFASVAAALYLGGGTARTISTYYTTRTVIAGTASLTAFPPGTLYDVTFKEGLGCGGYIEQWGVQLGNLTITQPPNIQLSQISENGYNASGKFDLTTITFSVPSGTYPFTLYPTRFSSAPYNNTAVGDIHGPSGSSGIVTVTDTNVTVDTLSGEMCA
jgi:hypothetical protein